jgi:ABC-type branched-subunit amino acid transport system substrate-binding protein
MKQAGELALFDRDDGSFQLMVLDDKGTPDGARQAAEQAVKDGAELILGPLFAGNVAGAAGPARAARIPLIAFSNDRQVAGNGVFIVGHTVETETDRVVGYAASRGLRRFAALVPDDAYGHLAEATMKGAAQRAGGSVVAVQRLPRQANGMLEPARQLGLALREVEAAGQPADALFLPGDPELLAQISPLMAYAGIEAAKLKILGTGAMDQPGLGRDKTYLGAWFAAPDPSGWRQFNSQFVKTYGSAPPRIATLAYDAVGMAISLSKAPAGTRYSPDTLTRSSGFAGVDGLLQLSSSGLPTRALAVLEVQDLGAIVVDPASAQPPTQVSAAGGRLN